MSNKAKMGKPKTTKAESDQEDEEFYQFQMKKIMEDIRAICARESVPFNESVLEGFEYSQLCQILLGYRAGYDITKVVTPAFGCAEIALLRSHLLDSGLHNKAIDMSAYAKPEYNEGQMKWISRGMFEIWNVSKYAIPELSAQQMGAFLTAMRDGIDVSAYAT